MGRTRSRSIGPDRRDCPYSRDFFTSDMGARLREIRRRRGLTLDEVASRMGLSGEGRHNLVARLESGRIASPQLRTVALFLRACGAKWFEFSDLLDRVELPPEPKLEPPVNASERHPEGLDCRDSPYSRTREETRNYQEKIAYPLQGAAMPPVKQAKAAAAYQEYRLQANVVKQKVLEYLATLDMNPIWHYQYQKLAERMLGALRKETRRRREPQTNADGRRLSGQEMKPQMHANERESGEKEPPVNASERQPESGITKNQGPGTKNPEMEPQVNASERNRIGRGMELPVNASERQPESGTAKNQEPGTKNPEMEPPVNPNCRGWESAPTIGRKEPPVNASERHRNGQGMAKVMAFVREQRLDMAVVERVEEIVVGVYEAMRSGQG